jgi:hypothetical protein
VTRRVLPTYAPDAAPPGLTWGSCVVCGRAGAIRPHDTTCDACADDVHARTGTLPGGRTPPVLGGGTPTTLGPTVPSWTPGESALGELWSHLDEVDGPPGLTVDLPSIDPSQDAPVTVWPSAPATTSPVADAVTAIRDGVTTWVREAAAWVGRLLDPQPPPVDAGEYALDRALASTRDDRIRALLLARAAQGIERYGVALRLGNGRSWDADLVQELTDARMYAEGVGPNAVAAVETALVAVLDGMGVDP